MERGNNYGAWSFGNGGHIVAKDGDGPSRIEMLPIREPSKLRNKLPFLMIPVFEHDRSKNPRDTSMYAEKREVIVDDVMYYAFYRKYIEVKDGVMSAVIDADMTIDIFKACTILYGGNPDEYLVLSEMLIFLPSERGVFWWQQPRCSAYVIQPGGTIQIDIKVTHKVVGAIELPQY